MIIALQAKCSSFEFTSTSSDCQLSPETQDFHNLPSPNTQMQHEVIKNESFNVHDVIANYQHRNKFAHMNGVETSLKKRLCNEDILLQQQVRNTNELNNKIYHCRKEINILKNNPFFVSFSHRIRLIESNYIM